MSGRRFNKIKYILIDKQTTECKACNSKLNKTLIFFNMRLDSPYSFNLIHKHIYY